MKSLVSLLHSQRPNITESSKYDDDCVITVNYQQPVYISVIDNYIPRSFGNYKLFADFAQNNISKFIDKLQEHITSHTYTKNNVFDEVFITPDLHDSFVVLTVNFYSNLIRKSLLELRFSQEMGTPAEGEISGTLVPRKDQGKIDNSKYASIADCIFTLFEQYIAD